MEHKTLYLFVPATRLDRVAKAAASGADVVVIDLEDAIDGSDKDDIRAQLLALDATISHSYWLRINGAQTAEFDADAALIAKLKHLSGILLPKCDTPADAARLTAITDLPVVPMIESAVGITNISEIAKVDGVHSLSFGCLDLMQSLGVRLGTAAADLIFDKIRMDLLIHSRANGLTAPIETIFTDFENSDALSACVRHWADFGFSGQLVIHPKQIATIRTALGVSEADLAFAKKIAETYERTGEAVFSVDGRMVDLPLIQWALGLVGK